MKDKNIKKCTYYIEGMHCTSCEVSIEKTLLNKKGVVKADADVDKGTVNFEYLGEKPTTDELSKILSDRGYKFSEDKNEKDVKEKLFSVENRKLIINKNRLKEVSISIGVVLVVIMLFYILQKSPLSSLLVVNQNSSYISFFLFGILAGLSSCAALVGGLLLSLTKSWNELNINEKNDQKKYQPYIMFNLGRILSFFILGGLLGTIGKALGITFTTNSILTTVIVMIVSVLMLILGLQMLEIKWAYKLRVALPKFISRNITLEKAYKGKYFPFTVGILTFFIPCGFTLIAQGLAFSSGNILRSALMMLSFVLGTLPMLILISFGSVQTVKKPTLNYLFNLIGGILVVVFAIYNINSQLNVLGLKSLNDISIFKTGSTNLGYARIDSEGFQIINIDASGFEYTPVSSTKLKAGIPAKIVVDNKGIEGCGVYLSAKGLSDKYLFLSPGENTIDVPNPVAGVYKITCSMGMVPPVTVTVTE